MDIINFHGKRNEFHDLLVRIEVEDLHGETRYFLVCVNDSEGIFFTILDIVLSLN